MKVLLSADHNQSREDYQTISSFDSFRTIATKRISDVSEMRINTYLLGLTCLYWLIDNCRSMLKKIKFVISLGDENQTECLKQMIRRYSKGDK